MRAIRRNAPSPAPPADRSADAARYEALVRGLALPATALRAAFQCIGSDLIRLGACEPVVEGIRAEIARVEANVETLLEFSRPPLPRPLRCTIDEIVLGARRDTDPATTLVLASSEPGATLSVDGPLLTRALRRLVQNAIEAGAERVLIAGSRRGARGVFSVVDDSPEPFDPETALRPFHTTRPARLGLGLTLVARDVALLGGRLAFLGHEDGPTCIEISIPSAAPEVEG